MRDYGRGAIDAGADGSDQGGEGEELWIRETER
jgi:hypothetical protein